MRAYVLPVLLLLISGTIYAQENAFEPVKPDELKAQKALPTIGKLSEADRDLILKTLLDSKNAKAPNIFNEQKIDPKTAPTTPESVYKHVIADLEAMAPEDRELTRYLSLYAIKPQERMQHALITSFVLNSLSWSHSINPPSFVPNTDNSLIKFTITNYTRNSETDISRWADTWELMSAADVYFMEPWVTREDALKAKTLSGSIGCVLRADWFNYYAMLDDDPATTNATEGFYSLFLGLPNTEEELLKFLSVDLRDLAVKGVDRAGIVTISGDGSDSVKVARNNRRINRVPSVLSPYGGYFYYTQDVLNSQGFRNFINNPLSDYKDGGEYIWRLPNGLQGYYLTQRQEIKVNNKNKVVFKRIAEVPSNVAVDPHFEDSRVKIRSCAYCHQNGINTFSDSYSILVAPKAPGGLVKPATLKFTDELRLNQLFYPDTQAYVVADQFNYIQALGLATGFKPAEFREIYKKCLDSYELPVSPERAAWEFGVATGVEGLEDYLADKVVSTTRGSLLMLVKGKSIQRDTFEEEFKNGKLLQQIKANIVPKNGKHQINLVVPSVVEIPDINTIVGTAITVSAATPVYADGSSRIIATVPANTKIVILKVQANGGIQYGSVQYNGQKGWIPLPK